MSSSELNFRGGSLLPVIAVFVLRNQWYTHFIFLDNQRTAHAVSADYCIIKSEPNDSKGSKLHICCHTVLQ